MRKTMVQRTFLTALALPAALAMTACSSDSGGRRGGSASSAAESTSRAAAGAPERSGLTGTLQSGAVAIGGETTGWRLVGDGQTGGVDVDVSKVRERAKALDGKRVTITGTMVDREWPKRGRVQVLVAEKIEEAKE